MRYLMVALMLLVVVSVSLAQEEIPTEYCVVIWDSVSPYANQSEEFEDQYFDTLEEAEAWLAESDVTLPPVMDIGYNRPAGVYIVSLQDRGAGLASPTLQELYVVHSLLRGVGDVYVYAYYPLDSTENTGNDFSIKFGDVCP